ncbi:hypothetical protein GGX14DRAFT_663798 [Mycena pura]|uniref:Uncharacterized protein n=1 Tax=Mycena pura TaxID=153505 RepID=A0AAD6YKX5_9AGAR|nr:hypothetical protein GGX14DRAFT_663798 [Mycena pura]
MEATRSTPIPYVLGFYLTPIQMRTIAREWLDPDVFEKCDTDRDYQCALVDYCDAKQHKWTFLPDKKEDSGELHYLWVIHVVPSWDGNNPKYPMPPKFSSQVQNKFGFENLLVCCMRWPRRLSPPMWLLSTMYKSIAYEKRRLERNTEEGIKLRPVHRRAVVPVLPDLLPPGTAAVARDACSFRVPTQTATAMEATRSVPIPYVLGFYLTPIQMRTIAREWLDPDVFEKCDTDRDYQCALVDYCDAKQHKWTFLPDKKEDSGELHYLWVIHVVPSWDGNNPKYPMPPKFSSQVQNKFGFEHLLVCCMRWPRRLSPPMWLLSTMYKSIAYEKRRLERNAEEGHQVAATTADVS